MTSHKRLKTSSVAFNDVGNLVRPGRGEFSRSDLHVQYSSQPVMIGPCSCEHHQSRHSDHGCGVKGCGCVAYWRPAGVNSRVEEPPRIHQVWRFANGRVGVCDQYGQQMPLYQGRFTDVRELVERDAPANALFHGWPGRRL
jgi:hypothetical protein